MKLQLALDFIDIEDALTILGDLRRDIDIVEVGTPFIVKDGLRPVRTIKKTFPDLRVLADLKIMDAGSQEAKMTFEAGADIVTVLGAAADATISAAADVAKAMNRHILVDMINIDELSKRAEVVDRLGVSFVCIHTAFDLRDHGTGPLNGLRSVKRALRNAQTAVAGGVTLETLKEVVVEKPDIIVVGGAVTLSKDKKKTVRMMKSIMQDGSR